MAELVPVPLPLLLRRAFLEYRQEGKIFDLPAARFFRGLPGLDTSVVSNGHRASTPLGPAAGPHDQLAQNIVLCWLGGARIIELKTVQILDELKIPRPCIDAANVGYNIEWSQELKLEQSLREYVGAAMFLEILKASHLLGDDFSGAWPGAWGDTIFDMSVGYNLEGIRSPRVTAWIQSMMNAAPVIDELRASLDGPFARYRDLPFPASISDTVTLSTFHGCPAGEIEGIVRFLLSEMGVNVCVKLNPTMLGREELEYLLHDVMGYREIQTQPDAFAHDLKFAEALDLIPRLQSTAHALGRHFSVKFSNTLVVKNHTQYFSDDVMYMSGPPLHVIAMNLVKKFRAAMGHAVAISFSAGIDAHNFAHAVAMDLVPVTTCTDLLRPGGYARLIRYMENLGEAMQMVGAATIADFVSHHRGQEDMLVDEATDNPRYAWERNKGVPRKIGSNLWIYDCISCDKCVPVCPNDANFSYQAADEDGKLIRQYANYADACNECGNCDVMCPEDGGPYLVKPRFFGSLESYRKYGHPNGFYIEYAGDHRTIYGTIEGRSYHLTVKRGVKGTVPDTGPYRRLKELLDAVGDPRHVHFANVAALSIEENQVGPIKIKR